MAKIPKNKWPSLIIAANCVFKAAWFRTLLLNTALHLSLAAHCLYLHTYRTFTSGYVEGSFWSTSYCPQKPFPGYLSLVNLLCGRLAKLNLSKVRFNRILMLENNCSCFLSFSRGSLCKPEGKQVLAKIKIYEYFPLLAQLCQIA